MNSRSRPTIGVSLRLLVLVGSSVATPLGAIAQTATLAPRDMPARSIPVPTTVSPEMQRIIAQPIQPNWDVPPKSGEEWRAAAAAGAVATARRLPGMLERLHVKAESVTIDGVKAFLVTPDTIPQKIETDRSSTSTAAAMCLTRARPRNPRRSSWQALGISR
jgi:hypothetical protein